MDRAAGDAAADTARHQITLQIAFSAKFTNL